MDLGFNLPARLQRLLHIGNRFRVGYQGSCLSLRNPVRILLRQSVRDRPFLLRIPRKTARTLQPGEPDRAEENDQAHCKSCPGGDCSLQCAARVGPELAAMICTKANAQTHSRKEDPAQMSTHVDLDLLSREKEDRTHGSESATQEDGGPSTKSTHQLASQGPCPGDVRISGPQEGEHGQDQWKGEDRAQGQAHYLPTRTRRIIGFRHQASPACSMLLVFSSQSSNVKRISRDFDPWWSPKMPLSVI